VFFSQCMYFWYLNWYAGLTPDKVLFAFNNILCSTNTTDNFTPNTTNTTNTTIFSNTTTTASPLSTFGVCATQDQLNQGQTVTFIAIVLCQIYILSTRTNYYSFFQSGPWLREHRNLWLFVGQAVSISIMILVVFLPFLNTLFSTAPPPAQFFFMPIVCGAIIFTVDEIRKLFVRRKMFYFHVWAW